MDATNAGEAASRPFQANVSSNCQEMPVSEWRQLTEGSEWLPIAAGLLLFVVLLGLELALPIHRSPNEGKGRLTANFGLGAINFSLFAALPLSSVLAAGFAQNHGFGVLNI